MGISGLLPLLKSIQVNTHIKQYAGKVVGIDAYGWLHRGAFACAWDIALGNPTTKYVDYAMHRIKMLRHYGVEPYVVFDGDYLPSKVHTESHRETRRAEHLTAGLRFHAQKAHAKATEQFQKCIDITPEMAYHFILALRREGISYVVAPYEADAQLAFLEKQGVISAIVTEDSDLLVFGARTLLLKMSQFGDCVEIKRDRFGNVTGQITLHGFTDEDFRHMAILSGCDYLPSVNGVGLITAHRLLRRFNKNISRVVQSLRLQVGTKVPPDYMEEFQRADLTFRHQRVFCPERECLVMWNEPDEPLPDETLVYIGADLDVEIARGVARGELHPMTKAPLGSASQDKENIKPSQYQSYISSYKPKPPTAPKTIKAFFSPRRPKSLQEVTPLAKKSDESRANSIMSTPQMFCKPMSSLKRSFTTVIEEETITLKRARKYLGSPEDERCITASPFFTSKSSKTVDMSVSESVVTLANVVVEEADLPMEVEELDDLAVDESEIQVEVPMDEVAHTANEMVDGTIQQRQVSESPPYKKPLATTDKDNQEIIPASPISIRPSLLHFLHNSPSSTISNPKSHPRPSPASPPPSRPIFIPLPSQRTATPILRPGMKKAYTPRPSNVIFPDTPTLSPELSAQQSHLVDGWKQRFLRSEDTTPTSRVPRLTNTISARPITPLHTPLFRRNNLGPR